MHALIGRQFVPVGRREGLWVFDAQHLDHLRELDPGPQNRPECHQVRIGAAVRLSVGMRGPEELSRPLVRQVFDRVDVVAAGVEAMVRYALGVLVGQEVGHRALSRQRREVLAGDHLDIPPLIGELLNDRSRDVGRHPPYGFQVGQVRQKPGR